MTVAIDRLVAETSAALGGPGERVGDVADAPRFALFHGANSICSQKVRAVLAHHAIPYVSHVLNMFAGQTYVPEYVRMRMVGCDALGIGLQAHHHGSTSASAGGCDGAVVPTLVDVRDGSVVVDSKRICFYLDDVAVAAGGTSLAPAGLHAAILGELDVVDNLPNYQMLNGRPPGEDRRPAGRRQAAGDGSGFSRFKVARCDELIAAHADEDALVRAYTAKRAKELQAAEELFAPEAMQAAYAQATAALAGLDRRLAGRTTAWMLAEDVTMADLYWVVELLRMENLGADVIWDPASEEGRLPAVAAFVAAGKALPAIRAAVLDWPGAVFH